MKIPFWLTTVLALCMSALVYAEDLQPIPESDIMGQASTEELGWTPRDGKQASDRVVEDRNDFANPRDTSGQQQFIRDEYSEEDSGRPVIPAMKQMRELELEETNVNWSFGVGTQYYLQGDLYPFVNLQMALGRNASIGLWFGSLGNWNLGAAATALGLTSLSDIQVTQAFFTMGLNSERHFRGLCLNGGAGVTIMKTAPTGGALEGDIYFIPTISGTLGWRWKLADANGGDDAVSLSLNGGIQMLYLQFTYNGLSASGFTLAPVARLELNFGW